MLQESRELLPQFVVLLWWQTHAVPDDPRPSRLIRGAGAHQAAHDRDRMMREITGEGSCYRVKYAQVPFCRTCQPYSTARSYLYRFG